MFTSWHLFFLHRHHAISLSIPQACPVPSHSNHYRYGHVPPSSSTSAQHACSQFLFFPPSSPYPTFTALPMYVHLFPLFFFYFLPLQLMRECTHRLHGSAHCVKTNTINILFRSSSLWWHGSQSPTGSAGSIFVLPSLANFFPFSFGYTEKLSECISTLHGQ